MAEREDLVVRREFEERGAEIDVGDAARERDRLHHRYVGDERGAEPFLGEFLIGRDADQRDHVVQRRTAPDLGERRCECAVADEIDRDDLGRRQRVECAGQPSSAPTTSSRPGGSSSGSMRRASSSVGMPHAPTLMSATAIAATSVPTSRHGAVLPRSTTNRAPPPSRASTHARPPCSAACSATSASPRPGAPVAVVGDRPRTMEPLEDGGAFLLCETGARVLHRDPQGNRRGRSARSRSRRRRSDRRCRAGWRGCVRRGPCRERTAPGPTTRRARARLPVRGLRKTEPVNSAGATVSSVSSAAPRSKREISSKSRTSRSKCRTWLRNTSTACRVRSSLRRSITSTAADIAVKGVRSSCVTSDANRVSRSTRCWSVSAMSLNEVASGARSASPGACNRVSRWPSAICAAPAANPRSGRNTCRLA